MPVYYFNDNFGDRLNELIWPRLIRGFQTRLGNSVFFGIGTLLSADIVAKLRKKNIPGNTQKLVFGTGIGYGLPPPILDKSWRIYFVRGPMTADALGLERSMAITDPGLLVRSIVGDAPSSEIEKTDEFVFMPHHVSMKVAGDDWKLACERAGVALLDPRDDPIDLLRRIVRARCVIAEAMHGAIVADALRIPWIPVVSMSQINLFKWMDWCQSVGVPFRPSYLAPFFKKYSAPDASQPLAREAIANVVVETINRLKSNERFLSEEDTIKGLYRRLQDKIATLRDDLESPNKQNKILK